MEWNNDLMIQWYNGTMINKLEFIENYNMGK